MSAKSATKPENMKFEAEVNQLLQLMIHSLYSNKEIFLRELVSNASDACDKLRFEAIKNSEWLADDPELRINVEFDEDAKTVTISDNGIGMTREDVINNIGTIARSGTAQFLSSLSGDQKKDAQLIGQFGVGFYSSFIVAKRVTIETRHPAADKKDGVRWISTGEDGYELESVEKESRGTTVILELRDEEHEFANDYRLRHVIKQYSDHIALPIMMHKPSAPTEEGEDASKDTAVEWEAINEASALWSRPRKDISEEEYIEFYKSSTYDFEAPLSWDHRRVEGKYDYTALLYIPSKAPHDLYEAESKQGVKLYVQRVFIMDDSKQLMPRYLRFIRGVIDSNDLPLNVSRELLQSNKVLDSIRSASVKRVLSSLEKMAKDDVEKYNSFWSVFGNVLKEGPVEDFANRELLLKLLRFASTDKDTEEQCVSLDDYVARMKEGQDKIYYITAESFAAAKKSPHLEALRKKGYEVLLMSDRVDEWLVGNVQKYGELDLQSVAKGDLDLGDDNDEAAEVSEDTKSLLERIKTSLSDKVDDVKVSKRLVSSPACVVLSEQEMALYMQQMLRQAGQDVPVSKPILEINPEHALVEKMGAEGNEDQFSEWSLLLFEQALLMEAGQLEDPSGFVGRMNRLIADLC